MTQVRPSPFFRFFLWSGFSSLLYEIVWTRLAMAAFGTTTTVLSVILSVFMLGLALGSLLGGSSFLLGRLPTARHCLRAYAVVELGIGIGGWLVPILFSVSRQSLLSLGETSSQSYHLASGLLIAISVLPWTTLMGATFPLALAALRAISRDQNVPGWKKERTFSFLYTANVFGATCGTLMTAMVLIEVFGFNNTVRIGSLINFTIFAAAWIQSGNPLFAVRRTSAINTKATNNLEFPSSGGPRVILVVLFGTGFASMGMELVWLRLYPYYIGTFVYAFAEVLGIYLLATYIGSWYYRHRVSLGRIPLHRPLFATLGASSLLPLVYADPRLLPHTAGWDFVWMVLSIGPFCAILGYLTPFLVDLYGKGYPGRAARAYAANIIGCILGPLASGYLLLPKLGDRGALVVLAVVPLAVSLWTTTSGLGPARMFQAVKRFGFYTANLAVAWFIAFYCRTYAEVAKEAVVRHDYAATVVAYGNKMNKRLLVNGVGMTHLTVVTKLMAHFPLAHMGHPPQSALIICFGMGTTFRSAASWNIGTTGVDLIPSVPSMFDYFFPDAKAVMSSHNNRIVIDDARRYLDRGRERFDLITVDPPPPPEAAASSLLYSREFYQAVKRRLEARGILQQWFPDNRSPIVSSVAKSLIAEFPYVRAFLSEEGWGIHFLASKSPIPHLSAAQLANRLPDHARLDLTEWQEDESSETLFHNLLNNEIPLADLLKLAPTMSELTDDRPVNEYFVLRKLAASFRPPPSNTAAE